MDEVIEHLSIILGHIVFIASLGLILSPLIAFLSGHENAVVLWLFAALLTSVATIPILSRYREFGIGTLWQSVIFLSRYKVLSGVALSFINLILLLSFGFQTMIPLFVLLAIYLCSSIPFFIFPLKRALRQKILTGFTLGPLLINTLLCFNYCFSTKPSQETYMIHWNWQRVKGFGMNGKTQRSSLISLSGNAYKNYPGIRVFLDFESISHFRKITYTFETGLFGIRVMKDYEFV